MKIEGIVSVTADLGEEHFRVLLDAAEEKDGAYEKALPILKERFGEKGSISANWLAYCAGTIGLIPETGLGEIKDLIWK